MDGFRESESLFLQSQRKNSHKSLRGHQFLFLFVSRFFYRKGTERENLGEAQSATAEIQPKLKAEGQVLIARSQPPKDGIRCGLATCARRRVCRPMEQSQQAHMRVDSRNLLSGIC